MAVEFRDNSMTVKAALSSKINSFLYEAGGEIQGATVRNSRTDTGQTKGSYKYVVQEGSTQGEVAVGSDYQNAIWEEFGTGQYALQGGGRQTPWVYKARNGKFYRTRGKTANRPLYKAFTSLSGKLKNRLESLLRTI